MNVNTNIVENIYEYSPNYLIHNLNGNQAGTYILERSKPNQEKPVSENLKIFYENSGGNLQNSILINNVQCTSTSSILKKANTQIGNNLKLASFFLPKNDVPDMEKPQILNNIILTPATKSTTVPVKVNTGQANVNNTVTVPVNVNNTVTVPVNVNNTVTVPVNVNNHINVYNKSAQIAGKVTNAKQTKILPKIKPKQNPSKKTSVKLLRLDGTYHSLNEISDQHKSIVNKALQNIEDNNKIPSKPIYDPVTNTRIIYKIVSPKDLAVVGNGKIVIKDKKDATKIENKKKNQQKLIETKDAAPQPPVEVKQQVTRSGRKVKAPNLIQPEDTPQRPRKKNGTVISCFQCSAEFNGLYRLQKHYENNPTHIPARIHSNLFHCLLAIIKSGSEEDRANILVQQLEQLIVKLKSLVPCLLKKIDGSEGKLCTINDDIGRLLDMNPGKYNFNMDAMSCIKDKDGHCRHNPSKNNPFNSDLSKPSQFWLSKHNEEIANNEIKSDDCARINSVEKLPTVSKRIWNIKQRKSHNAKRLKLTSENETSDAVIELGSECAADKDSGICISQSTAESLVEENNEPNQNMNQLHNINEKEIATSGNETTQSKGHVEFHSTHFDIRSSPIKTSSAIFRTFQIVPEKITNYDAQVMKRLTMEKTAEDQSREIVMTSNENALNLQGLLMDNIDLHCKDTNAIQQDINFDNNKHWSIAAGPSGEQSHENYIKPTSLIKPTLIHVKDNNVDISKSTECNEYLNRSQNQSVLNFLDSLGNDCLTYPEAVIKNNSVDFQLDLFSLTSLGSDSMDCGAKKDSVTYPNTGSSISQTGEILQSSTFPLSLNPER